MHPPYCVSCIAPVRRCALVFFRGLLERVSRTGVLFQVACPALRPKCIIAQRVRCVSVTCGVRICVLTESAGLRAPTADTIPRQPPQTPPADRFDARETPTAHAHTRAHHAGVGVGAGARARTYILIG